MPEVVSTGNYVDGTHSIIKNDKQHRICHPLDLTRRIQNPEVQRAGRSLAAHAGKAGQGRTG